MKTVDEIYLQNGCNKKSEILEAMKEYGNEVLQNALSIQIAELTVFRDLFQPDSTTYKRCDITIEFLKEYYLPKYN